MRSFTCWLSIVFVIQLSVSLAEEPLTAPDRGDGTKEATQAMAKFRKPDGFAMQLFAAEPQLANPVAFCLDEHNRVFVAEQYRFNRGTEENRTRPFLLEDDLQIETTQQRLEMYRKWAHKFEGGMGWFRRVTDQVRLLEDSDGDGKADISKVFATGFNDPLDGLAAGIIAREGNLYLTCIPNLWLLKDTDGDRVAEVRKVVHTGFGVNCAFLGHDLHGLVWGPDGKLYFSVGDRGFHVKTREGKVLHGPRMGGVFRCNPDGSDLEVIYRGLRNPQELAFDQYGNLFAADNNCDKGDHSRLVYIVEGGTSGWNMAYQTMDKPYLTGPWHAEKMWHLPHPGQPAWLVPPVAKLGSGPSGFVYNPGTGLPAKYHNYFFMCNYTGNGGVEAIRLKPHGAGFAIDDYHDFLKPIRATDFDFGYDGKLYVSDYVKTDWKTGGGWGRIYTLAHPEIVKSPTVREVKSLFAAGIKQRSVEELAGLLAHSDMRVRLRAQYALAEKQGDAQAESIRALTNIATKSEQQLARLHAMWGLGQFAAAGQREVLKAIAGLLNDSDAEVRAQAVKLVGDHRYQPATKKLIARLSDPQPRVRMFAALGLGKLGAKNAVEPVFEMLRANKDQDPWLRHAGVMALLGSGDADAVLAKADDKDAAVRMAVVLVLRRRKDPRVAKLLSDADVLVATEAARAINDLPISEALPKLADQIKRISASSAGVPEAFLRRVINANFRLGGSEQLAAVAQFVTGGAHAQTMRAEALAAVADWAEPSPRDRVIGFWRPLEPRDRDMVRQTLERFVSPMLANTSGELQTAATKLIGKYDLKADNATFLGWLKDRKRATSTRIAALQLLAQRKFDRLDDALKLALADDNPRLRAAARHQLCLHNPQQGINAIKQVFADSDCEVLEQQRALATLAGLKQQDARQLLRQWAERLVAGDVPPALQLDVREAIEKAKLKQSKEFLKRLKSQESPDDPLAAWRMCLEGGDSVRGRELFIGHRAAQCIRCHKINGQGGEAGPDLSKVSEKNKREHLLQSLIDPNAKVAEGFGTVVLALTSGKLVAGVLKKETKTELTIVTPEEKTIVISAAEVEERTPPKSAMPEMKKVLQPRDVRDLVEYLSTLK